MEQFTKHIAHYPSATYKKGQTILLKNDNPQAVYVIESGTVRAYTITQDGAERLVAVHSKNEDIPAGFAFGLSKTSKFFYEAYSDCRIRLVPRAAFEHYMRSNPDVMFQWHVRAEALLLATLLRVNALEQPRAGDKIALMMYYMATQFGAKMRVDQSRLRLTITQQELADSLGLTRETTGSELKKLELKKLITHSRKKYTLYMDRLRKYIDDRS